MTLRIANVITRMIVGGPQQVSLLAAAYYRDLPDVEYHLVCGEERGAEGDYHREIAASGITWHALPSMVREVRPLTDLRGLMHLYALFRRIRPHVVHCRSAKARFIGPLAAQLARVPVIVQTVHGWSFNNAVDSRKPVFVALEKVARAACHVSVFVSSQDLDEGIALGIVDRDALADGRAAIIRSGVDLSKVARAGDEARARIRRENGVGDARPVLSLVQRLSEPKTPLVFVEALKAVVARRPDAVAWIVGDGLLRAPTEQAVRAAGLDERVRFLGVSKDVPGVLTASDVVVHSSLREGLPRVVLETLAVGTPLVATDVGGVGEVVRDGENGRLVPPSDPARLAAALLDTLADPAAAAARAERGKRAVDPFSARRMLDDQHALYLRLLRERGQPALAHAV
jgi:glycosyltransferase involved in cell wall biosynthesis